MIAQEAIEIWAKGREFPYLSDDEKELYFQSLTHSWSSIEDDERGWAIEALYRLLWDFSVEQRDKAINLLIKSISDGSPKCSERAVKGLQFAVEFMTEEHAVGTLKALMSVTSSSLEIIQVVAIELAYSLYTLFGRNSQLIQASLFIHFQYLVANSI